MKFTFKKTERTSVQMPVLRYMAMTGWIVVHGKTDFLAAWRMLQQDRRAKGIVWRQNTGGFRGNYNGKTRFVKFGVAGLSDIIGVARDGRFVAIECKQPGNKPTPDQDAFLGCVRECNGLAIVAHGIDDVRGIGTTNSAASQGR